MKGFQGVVLYGEEEKIHYRFLSIRTENTEGKTLVFNLKRLDETGAAL